MRIEKYRRVAVGSDRAEGVEHSRSDIWQRSKAQIGYCPDSSLDCMQYCPSWLDTSILHRVIVPAEEQQPELNLPNPEPNLSR